MNIRPGHDLLHYHIVDKIGEGGMGVVWRAVDTTLDREVAVKVLPETVGNDPTRLMRFEREAKLLASLNHPNIAAVYGLHEADGARFIVMELVAGEDLAQRISRGRVPLDEARVIAGQIADALETAHDQGVIHRDLKPANVRLTPEGRVKVLDFGLAKALSASPDSGDPAMSPTVTSMQTAAGVILGTAAYMSPEQVRGKGVDRRADIWAFGCVVYEMLVGRRPHRAETMPETLAAVLRDEVDLGTLPAATPRALRVLLARCLDRDPRTRLQAIGEARIVLQRSPVDEPIEVGEARQESPAPRAWPWLVAVVGALSLGLVLGTLAPWRSTGEPPTDERSSRNFVIPAEGRHIDDAQAISPDGKWVAYTASGLLWVRNLGELQAREVPDSAGARALFWSPRSDALAFAAGDRLYRFSLQGGRPVALCRLAGGDFTGGSWSATQGIVFTVSRANWDGDVLHVSEDGGEPATFTQPDTANGERRLHSPHFLPDGKTLLYAVVTRNANAGELAIDRDGVRTYPGIHDGIGRPVYSPTGHIVFTRVSGAQRALWAVPFSLETLTPTGDPFQIVADGTDASVADDGTLVYALRHPEPHQLVWVDRTGALLETLGDPMQASLWTPAVSPDGQRVAATVDWLEVSVWDVDRQIRTRITDETEKALFPDWRPDGESVVYSLLADDEALAVRRADGSGQAQTLLRRAGVAAPDYTPDGKFLAFYVVDPDSARDLWALAIDDPSAPFEVLRTPANEAMPRISPDGLYVAYQSDVSGRWEIYIRPFPAGEGRWQVSVDGGQNPTWNPSGGELFFVSGNDLMAADVTTQPEVRVGTPERLFSADVIGTRLSLSRFIERLYDPAPDGNRFVLVSGVRKGTSDVVVSENVLD